MHLWPLLLLDGDSDEEKREKYRALFIETYVVDKSGNPLVFEDWTGKKVHFASHCADHVLSGDEDYRFKGGGHEIAFKPDRAHRIMWVKEVLSASAGTLERYSQIRKDSRGRQKKRRVIIVAEERYVVVLEEKNPSGELHFITAFPADRGYVAKIKKESTYLETKKPQS